MKCSIGSYAGINVASSAKMHHPSKIFQLHVYLIYNAKQQLILIMFLSACISLNHLLNYLWRVIKNKNNKILIAHQNITKKEQLFLYIFDIYVYVYLYTVVNTIIRMSGVSSYKLMELTLSMYHKFWSIKK